MAIRLNALHGRTQTLLYRVYSDPVLVPPSIQDAEALIEWLLSEPAGLVPRDNWWGTIEETAIVAILCKLVQNKSWSKDTQAHQWTKHEDLFGQWPVMRNGFQEVHVEAKKVAKKLEKTLLLKKGSGQGKTPREWAINIAHVSNVKEAILKKSLDPLRAIDGLDPVIESASNGARTYDIGNLVVKERVRQLCREQH